MPRLARENTLPSFALALEAGADGLELDVHATRDGVVIIHHDPESRHGAIINDLTFAELRQYEVAPGVVVPTLAELCDLVAGRAELFVEIKGHGIEQLVLDTLSEYSGSFAIHSFDHGMIRRLHALAPALRLGILFEDSVRDVLPQMQTTGALDVWPQWQLVSAELVETVHAAGGRVIPWTVNDASAAQQLAASGVDGLCGDDVRLFGTS